MFCAECGTKNEVGAQFCENCGNKMETAPVVQTQPVQPQQPVVPPTPKKGLVEKIKELPKTTKIIAIVATVVVVAIVALYVVLNGMTSAKGVAEKFFNATMDHDLEKMYSFISAEESQFTTEEMFKKINAVNTETENLPKVVNYTVGEPIVSADGMSATVTISYVIEGDSATKTADIKLTKGKDKKWIIFDDWKINNSNTKSIKGYEIEVMKDSTVTIEDVKVDKKYIDKEKSTSTNDVYVMPAMFGSEYGIVIDLPIGVTLEDEIYVSSGSSYTYSLSLDNLTEEMKQTLQTTAKTNLQDLYNGVKDKKAWDEVKTSFEYENADLSDLKYAYEKLSSNISSDITLTSIEFTEIELDDLSVTSEGQLYVELEASYDYILTYISGTETKTNDSDDTDYYIYLTYDYVDGAFKLVDASSLTSYFSKYY